MSAGDAARTRAPALLAVGISRPQKGGSRSAVTVA